MNLNVYVTSAKLISSEAWTYYELVKIFGGVPLRTTIEAVNLPRASVDEVYALIASDIKNAIEMMPNQIYPAGNAMAGHATKYAAEALAAQYFYSIPDVMTRRLYL